MEYPDLFLREDNQIQANVPAYKPTPTDIKIVLEFHKRMEKAAEVKKKWTRPRTEVVIRWLGMRPIRDHRRVLSELNRLHNRGILSCYGGRWSLACPVIVNLEFAALRQESIEAAVARGNGHTFISTGGR